jgi:hypothetical protein
MKYKVTAVKKGQILTTEKIEANKDGIIFAIWYRQNNKLSWIFTEDLDEFRIEEVK